MFFLQTQCLSFFDGAFITQIIFNICLTKLRYVPNVIVLNMVHNWTCLWFPLQVLCPADSPHLGGTQSLELIVQTQFLCLQNQELCMDI